MSNTKIVSLTLVLSFRT